MSLFPRRFRFQLSLRTALFLFLLACFLLGSGITWRQRALLQQDVIRQLKGQLRASTVRSTNPSSADLFRSDAICRYDFQLTNDPVQGQLFEPKPSWLSTIFGVDLIHSVREVEFLTKAHAAHFEQLNRLGYVTHLNMPIGVAKAEDWRALSTLSGLKSLTVDASRGETIPGLNRFEHICNLTRLAELHLIQPQLSEIEWESILAHPTIKVLSLQRFGGGENPIRGADSVTGIESLYFTDCEAAEETLKGMLTRFGRLKLLSIEFSGRSQSTCSDKLFETIPKLEMLEQLLLYRTTIEGHNLNLLRELPLRKLALGLSGLDDEGSNNLADFKRLEYLEVGSTKISDVGLERLAQLSRLEYLSIRDTIVTDKGLKQLSQLKRLKLIRIRDTRITEDGVQDFRRQLPNCRVDAR
jgi:hypothetical protein